jgi:hypothetical protein
MRSTHRVMTKIISPLVVAGLLLAGCSQKPPAATNPPSTTPDPNAVATINGAVVSRQMLEERLKRGGRGTTLQTALEELIGREATYQKAMAAGLDHQPDVQARIKNLIVAQFREQQARLTNSPAVAEAELEAAYRAQAQRFQVRAAARGAVIFVSAPRTATPEKRAETLRRAEAVLAEARAAADDRAFAQVVARHSDDQATRYRGGDTDWFEREGTAYEPALSEALSRLATPGEFAPVIETPRGFYIAKLIAKRDAAAKPLSEVKESLRYELSRQKAQQAEREFHEAMKTGLDIQVHQAALDSISIPGSPNSPSEPPSMPGATTAQLR